MLKQSRLDALADGIFAIVMTLLVIEIRVPELAHQATNSELIHFLGDNAPLFISYVLSFSLLFIYWRGHHYIASILARNIDNHLSTINAIFLMFVALTPFTTHFLGEYYDTQVAVVLYGINIILISLSLFWMRTYIKNSRTINNKNVSNEEEVRGMMRIMIPTILSLIAIGVAFIDPKYALLIYVFIIFFNLSSRSTHFIYSLFYDEHDHHHDHDDMSKLQGM